MGPVSFFLVFLAIVLIGATLWAGAGGQSGFFGRRSAGDPNASGLLDAGFEQPVANLPPVLLPADAVADDVDKVRFSLALRGYRMDQVDQVLDELRDQLAGKYEEIEKLRAQLLEAEHSKVAGVPAVEPAPEVSSAKPDRSAAGGGL
ncbi:MAG TPA: DivIVA domain-containing protein [Arthrobacter sp.]|jgi:DivIVA domain-containing protein